MLRQETPVARVSRQRGPSGTGDWGRATGEPLTAVINGLPVVPENTCCSGYRAAERLRRGERHGRSPVVARCWRAAGGGWKRLGRGGRLLPSPGAVLGEHRAEERRDDLLFRLGQPVDGVELLFETGGRATPGAARSHRLGGITIAGVADQRLDGGGKRHDTGQPTESTPGMGHNNPLPDEDIVVQGIRLSKVVNPLGVIIYLITPAPLGDDMLPRRVLKETTVDRSDEIRRLRAAQTAKDQADRIKNGQNRGWFGLIYNFLKTFTGS